jgi:predicted nucleic acid-binding protein
VRAYIDSSVLIRVVFQSPNPLAVWDAIEYHVSSVLLRLEYARTLERLRFNKAASPAQITNSRAAFASIIDRIEMIKVDDEVLNRASAAFPLPLKSLDAIHLASAMMWRDHEGLDLAFATHDDKLARTARAAGFEVLGA